VKANPFAPVTNDEVTVVNHLQTLLLKLDSGLVQEVLNDIVGEEIPVFDNWQTEKQVASGEHPEIDAPDGANKNTFLLGLSEQPAVITDADLEATDVESDEGRVDLYATGPGLFIIEAKTIGSLSESQLTRYQNSLPGETKFKTISWADLSQALEAVKPKMSQYERGLTEDYLTFLDEAGLGVPHRLVQRPYVKEDGTTGLKKFAIKGGEPLSIEFSWEENGVTQNTIELDWQQFVELFEQVDPDVLDAAFVQSGDFDGSDRFNDSTELGAIDPLMDSDSNIALKFVYSTNGNALKLGHRLDEGGKVGSPRGKGRQAWMIAPGEGTDLFIYTSEQYPGLNESLREALFVEFDRETVKEALW